MSETADRIPSAQELSTSGSTAVDAGSGQMTAASTALSELNLTRVARVIQDCAQELLLMGSLRANQMAKVLQVMADVLHTPSLPVVDEAVCPECSAHLRARMSDGLSPVYDPMPDRVATVLGACAGGRGSSGMLPLMLSADWVRDVLTGVIPWDQE